MCVLLIIWFWMDFPGASRRHLQQKDQKEQSESGPQVFTHLQPRCQGGFRIFTEQEVWKPGEFSWFGELYIVIILYDQDFMCSLSSPQSWTALEMFSLCSFHAPSYADISWLLQYKIPPWNQGLVLDLFTVFHCWITMMKDIYGYITSTMGWFQEMGLPTKQPLQLRDFATGFQVVQLLHT